MTTPYRQPPVLICLSWAMAVGCAAFWWAGLWTVAGGCLAGYVVVRMMIPDPLGSALFRRVVTEERRPTRSWETYLLVLAWTLFFQQLRRSSALDAVIDYFWNNRLEGPFVSSVCCLILFRIVRDVRCLRNGMHLGAERSVPA